MSALNDFAKWAIKAGAWGATTLDGGDIQEKAIALGLLKEVRYDPAVHGPNDVDAQPGDQWFIFAGPLVRN